jgi:hypothetical protein
MGVEGYPYVGRCRAPTAVAKSPKTLDSLTSLSDVEAVGHFSGFGGEAIDGVAEPHSVSEHLLVNSVLRPYSADDKPTLEAQRFM